MTVLTVCFCFCFWGIDEVFEFRIDFVVAPKLRVLLGLGLLFLFLFFFLFSLTQTHKLINFNIACKDYSNLGP